MHWHEASRAQSVSVRVSLSLSFQPEVRQYACFSYLVSLDEFRRLKPYRRQGYSSRYCGREFGSPLLIGIMGVPPDKAAWCSQANCWRLILELNGSVMLTAHTSLRSSAQLCINFRPRHTSSGSCEIRAGGSGSVRGFFEHFLILPLVYACLSSVGWTVGPWWAAFLQRRFHPITTKGKRQTVLESSASIIEPTTCVISTFNLRSVPQRVNSSETVCHYIYRVFHDFMS
jgi:hypothetical protein